MIILRCIGGLGMLKVYEGESDYPRCHRFDEVAPPFHMTKQVDSG